MNMIENISKHIKEIEAIDYDNDPIACYKLIEEKGKVFTTLLPIREMENKYYELESFNRLLHYMIESKDNEEQKKVFYKLKKKETLERLKSIQSILGTL